MNNELIPIQFNKIMQSHSYTVFILGTPEKRFAIYTAPHVGKNIQKQLAKQKKARPHVSDLIHAIFQGLEIHLIQVVITDLQDTVYFSRLFVEQMTDKKRKILEIDARPSDSLALAILNEVPIYCTQEVWERVLPLDE